MHQVIIAGGGLAGLLNAILLAKAGVSCLVIEKKSYPFHKVCGEFISNEVRAYLEARHLFPHHLGPVNIQRLLIGSQQGATRQFTLPMGGFGISRYQLENYWYQEACRLGVDFELNTSVTGVTFQSGGHQVKTNRNTELAAPMIIGAYGKRSKLDKQLHRPFIGKRSAFLGVKYHVRYPWDPGVIALFAFNKGYCGISMVEDGRLNLCYLSSRLNLRDHGSIESLEQEVLWENPQIASVLKGSEPLFTKPLVINEISFEPKRQVVDHMLMCGDSAGMITPLCGNGMAMAIHSAALLAPKLVRFFRESSYTRERLEMDYTREWRNLFSRRLATGRYLQQAFFHRPAMNLLLRAAGMPLVARWIVSQTHGDEL